MTEVVVSVHQPNWMPWLKLLDKILRSDVYVAYDTVIYTRTEYHNRQRIKRDGKLDWLTVPLVKIPGTQQLISEVRIDDKQPFRVRQLRSIRQAYGAAPHFDEFYPVVEQVYRGGQERLVDLNLDLIRAICGYLGSDVRIVAASTLEPDIAPAALADGTLRLVELTRAVGGTVHLTSTYGTERNYVDWDRMLDAGVEVRSQEFTHPEYPQPKGEFLPHLAAVDMLFRCGRSTADVLREHGRAVPIGASASP